MLRTALEPDIAAFLEDPAIVEVMLNPDGRLWGDRLSGGLEETGATMSPADGERIVRLVAHHVGAEVHAGSPRVSAELPETGERFEGLLPSVAQARSAGSSIRANGCRETEPIPLRSCQSPPMASAGRTAEIEGEHLGFPITPELQGDPRQQHRLVCIGRADDQDVDDIAAVVQSQTVCSRPVMGMNAGLGRKRTGGYPAGGSTKQTLGLRHGPSLPPLTGVIGKAASFP